MQLGFAIDQDACVGCHACTVACKAENDVPVGSFRTWVKYTEEGQFPTVERSFSVLRCNHCTDAPCVTICPVNALEKRDDGIVDIDRDACIGCRACMQACPYDAIYLNEDSGAVEKCHFCAHRVENNLEPACVTVCPVGAIIAGDLHDPESKPSQAMKNRKVTTRRIEQGTGPNVRYLGGNSETALKPGQAETPNMFLWSDLPPGKPDPWPASLPIVQDARVVLNTGHRIEWGMGVAAYLVTKGIAAGVMTLAPFAGWLGLGDHADSALIECIPLFFLLLTCGLLVEDLARPMKFYRMLTRPNWRSWLVRGGVILTAAIVMTGVGAACRWLGAPMIADVLRWLGVPVGLAVAGYTAYLFAQCKGRDLWESPLLLPHLLVQGVFCGAACLLALASAPAVLIVILILSGLAHVALSIHEKNREHTTDNARQAAAFLGTIRLGPVRPFRDGLIIGVGVACLAALFVPALAVVLALGGLFLYEHAFIRAGQLPPLS